MLRALAVAAFIAGAALLALGLLWTLEGRDDPPTAPEGFVPFLATPTSTPTEPPTDVPMRPPTPTPVPYGGQIARFQIPRFAVDAPIEVLGILPDNTLDSPHNPLAVGWYDLYARPGFGSNSLFAAHVDYYPNILGPFHKLSKLELDDEVAIVMDNGLTYRYRVISKQRYPLAEIRMGEIIDAPARPKANEWVTMITCGGEFTPLTPGGAGSYGSRDVVVAERFQ